MQKIANIVSRPTMTDDSGRALGLEWQLFLNDFGGDGFWHGGPNSPNHATSWKSKAEAQAEAERLGYAVTATQWM